MNHLEKAVADLRDAYHQLTAGVVKDQAKFADGLIAPAIQRIEAALTPVEPVAWLTKKGSVWKSHQDESDMPLYTAAPQPQPKQEPVGYFTINDYDMWEQVAGTAGNPLYDAPQPQQWVGLTDAEVLRLEVLPRMTIREVYAVIEARLREKNGGVL